MADNADRAATDARGRKTAGKLWRIVLDPNRGGIGLAGSGSLSVGIMTD